MLGVRLAVVGGFFSGLRAPDFPTKVSDCELHAISMFDLALPVW